MRYLLLLATAAALGAATMNLSVEKLKEFIQSAIQMKSPDIQVAQYLRNVKMTEKLDDATVEELQNKGAGPKTVAALRSMVDATASLPQAAPPPPKAVYVPPPPPDSEEQSKILDEAREYVQNYTKNLPNFICVQVTRRSFDPKGGNNWYKGDTLVGQRENERARFFGSPNTRSIRMPASALGTGHFRVECLVNGTKISSVQFDIN